MKGIKSKVLGLIAKAGMKTALKSAGAASTYSYHQPKEPEALKKMKKM